MFIAMNRFRVKKGCEQAFEQVWLNRESYLDRMPGFLEFHLLKGPERDDHPIARQLRELGSEMSGEPGEQVWFQCHAPARSGGGCRQAPSVCLMGLPSGSVGRASSVPSSGGTGRAWKIRSRVSRSQVVSMLAGKVGYRPDRSGRAHQKRQGPRRVRQVTLRSQDDASSLRTLACRELTDLRQKIEGE